MLFVGGKKIMNLSKRKKKLLKLGIVFVVLLFVGMVAADMFSAFVNYSNEFTVDEPIFQVSATGPTGDWHPAQEFTFTGTPVTSGNYLDMVSTSNLWIASIDPITIYFHDTSDEGMYCKIALSTDPTTYLTSFDLGTSQTYQFIITCSADPRIMVGTWEASLVIDDIPPV